MSFDFELDTKQLHEFILALGKSPEQLQKATARFLKDQARSFHYRAKEELRSRYTIRDEKFFKGGAWTVQEANESDPINEQKAIVASMRIENSSAGLFTGWEEELTGAPREMRRKGSNKYHRVITSTAREEGSMYGLSLHQYRFRSGGIGHDADRIPDFREYGLPLNQFLAMIHKSDASGRSKKAAGRPGAFRKSIYGRMLRHGE